LESTVNMLNAYKFGHLPTEHQSARDQFGITQVLRNLGSGRLAFIWIYRLIWLAISVG